MIDIVWVRIRSWHILNFYDRGGGANTLCGRRVGGMDEPPVTIDVLGGGRSCESCLRIHARIVDAPQSPDSGDVGE